MMSWFSGLDDPEKIAVVSIVVSGVIGFTTAIIYFITLRATQKTLKHQQDAHRETAKIGFMESYLNTLSNLVTMPQREGEKKFVEDCEKELMRAKIRMKVIFDGYLSEAPIPRDTLGTYIANTIGFLRNVDEEFRKVSDKYIYLENPEKTDARQHQFFSFNQAVHKFSERVEKIDHLLAPDRIALRKPEYVQKGLELVDNGFKRHSAKEMKQNPRQSLDMLGTVLRPLLKEFYDSANVAADDRKFLLDVNG